MFRRDIFLALFKPQLEDEKIYTQLGSCEPLFWEVNWSPLKGPNSIRRTRGHSGGTSTSQISFRTLNIFLVNIKIRCILVEIQPLFQFHQRIFIFLFRRSKLFSQSFLWKLQSFKRREVWFVNKSHGWEEPLSHRSLVVPEKAGHIGAGDIP